jgi:UDP-GlcNAc:undecaprenyl-phosphate GlcNAc-1-phosphate transferase
MTFPFNAYLLAVLSACATVLATLPLWRKWCLRAGLMDDPGERKIHHQPVPLAGGLAVMTGLVAPTLLAWLALRGLGLSSHAAFLLRHGFSRRGWELAGLLAGAFGSLAIGWLDDRYELGARTKFAGQFLVAALVAVSGARITLFVPSLPFSYAITILWILTVMNALNFMDNMNGLCAGLGATGALAFGVRAAAQGQYLVALIALLSFGALLGFLPYNFPRARAFLGDAGSHLVGYLLAVLAILPHFYTSARPGSRWAVLLPLCVLAVPLADLVWVVLLRLRLGKPFYQGDTNHLSHRLVRLGYSPTQAVLLIWLAAGVCGLVCLL